MSLSESSTEYELKTYLGSTGDLVFMIWPDATTRYRGQLALLVGA